MTYTETEMDGLTQKYFFSGYEAGKKDERERIIALLEARHKDLSSCHSDDECQSLKWGVDLAISDIEGDNK